MLHWSPSVFRPWDNFYVITGSAAASLLGLMFVVITLVASLRTPSTRRGIATFSTPTVVQFAAALGVAAILAAPWPTTLCAATLIAFGGLCCLVYSLRMLSSARAQEDYEPDVEDLIFYQWLPPAVYLALIVCAIALPFAPRPTLFAIAAIALSLVFMGIHNAWDVVTYVTAKRLRAGEVDDEAEALVNPPEPAASETDPAARPERSPAPPPDALP
ncbi:MAG TPA: hypothetical protein VHT53_09295 [Candidatus Elarobacter sp.]|nr:hypothetical protein [Candidatus Elarobacter sp.]